MSKKKGLVIAAAVAAVVCIVLAGRALMTAGKLSAQIEEANAQIEKLQSSQNDASSAAKMQKTIDAQEETISSLQEDSDALVKLIGMEYLSYSEEDLEGVTLHELLQQLIAGGYLTSVHEIWDDTAVVNAYLTGDDSAITDEQSQYVLEKVREIIPQIITDDMTDYEKEKAVYDWQVRYVNYADNSLDPIPENDEDTDVSYLPYGVLRYREAICVGNATTFKLFMDCLEIPCMIIHSTEEGEHAWNLVQIDEDWYHVDVTFDTVYGSEPAYLYFNVTDSVKEQCGYPWDEDEFPSADSVKYNYVYMNAVTVENPEELPKLLAQAMAGGSSSVYLRFSSDISAYVYGIVNTVAQNVTDGYLDIGEETYTDEGDVLLGIYYQSYSTDPENPDDPGTVEYDEELVKKINEVMEEEFGYEMDMSLMTSQLYYYYYSYVDDAELDSAK